MLVGGLALSPDQEDVTDVGPIYEALENRDFSDVILVCLVPSTTPVPRAIKQFCLNIPIKYTNSDVLFLLTFCKIKYFIPKQNYFLL